MDCNKAREITDLLLDDSITNQQKMELFIHFDSCRSCYENYQKALKMQALYRTIPQRELPEGFHRRLFEKIDILEAETARSKNSVSSLCGKFSGFMAQICQFMSNSSQRAVATAVILLLAGLSIIIGGGFTDNPAVTPSNALLLAYAERPLKVKTPGNDLWSYVDRSLILPEGSAVKTGHGRAVLMIGDRVSIRLATNSEVRIIRMSLEKDRSMGLIGLEKGNIWIDEIKNADIQVICMGDTVKPRGTAFQVSLDRNGNRDISCLEGVVTVDHREMGAEIELEEGERLLSSYKKGIAQKEQIEKIDGNTLEKDDWIRWNRQLKPAPDAIEGIPLSAPARTLMAKPQRPWEKRQLNAENPGPLVLPKNPAQRNIFNASQRQWRLMSNRQVDSFNGLFGSLSENSRRMIIKELKSRTLLPKDHPGDSMTLPVTVQTAELMEKIEKILESENYTKEIRQVQEQFSNLPQKQRIEIIDTLKGRKVLGEDFPVDSTLLPPDAVRYMLRFKVRKEQLRIHRINP